jgi:hypothetical protein
MPHYKNKEAYEFDAHNFGRHFLKSIMQWLAANVLPGEVFYEGTLQTWAEQNGYVLKSEVEQNAG